VYKIDIGFEIFLTAGLASLIIALATIGYQSIKSALINPVDSLRSE
jgi:putative ABC transport system permease protein